MTTWLTRRPIQVMPEALVMTAIVFLGLHLIGDPVDNRSQGCARSHVACIARGLNNGI
jgi:hypothetical protein